MQSNRTLAIRYHHKQFLKLYLGKTPIAGNATQCYKAVYGNDLPERSAQSGASRLLQLDHIKRAIIKAEALALKRLAVDAQYVLEENMRLYSRAMGDDSYDEVRVFTDPDTGQERVELAERRSYDPATAHKALTSIGQHRDVQAFTQTVEHTHTHVLEQRLAARSKIIEGRSIASDLQAPAAAITNRHQLPHRDDLPAHSEVAQVIDLDDDESVPEPEPTPPPVFTGSPAQGSYCHDPAALDVEPGDDEDASLPDLSERVKGGAEASTAGYAPQSEKVPSGGGQTEMNAREEETSSGRAGATV